MEAVTETKTRIKQQTKKHRFPHLLQLRASEQANIVFYMYAKYFRDYQANTATLKNIAAVDHRRSQWVQWVPCTHQGGEKI